MAEDITAFPTSKVVDKSLVEAGKIASAYNKKLVSSFRSLTLPVDDGFISDILASTKQATEAVGKLLFDSEVAGFVEGGVSGAVAPFLKVAGKQQTESGFFNPPPTEDLLYPFSGDRPSVKFPVIENAGKILQDSTVMQPNDFYSLANDARENAFTISGDLEEGSIQQIKSILSDNINTITSRTDFMNKVREGIPKLPLSDANLEQVFRNNVNAAYSDGTEQVLQNEIVSTAFPYRAYNAIFDSRAREEHKALESLGLNGTNVYYFRDPVWSIFRPPWDWNCRCGWIAFTIRQAARAGVEEAIQWLDTGIEPIHGMVAQPNFLPPESWIRKTLQAS